MRQRVATSAAVGAVLSVGTVLALGLLSGCRSAVSLNREAVVTFKPGSTVADRDRVRNACGGATPHASLEPTGPGTLASSRANDVRFRIDHADNSDLARLYACLNRDPSVRGVDVPDFGG